MTNKFEDFPIEYQRLIKQVRQIDGEAAEYLENEAPKRADFIRYSYDLSECFSFRNAPQGHHYWWQIFDKLEQKRAEYDDLVCRIASLGIEQSVIDYLRGEAMDLESFNLSRYLDNAFVWSKTPQGAKFWRDLNKDLYTKSEVFTGTEMQSERNEDCPELELEPEPQEKAYHNLEALQKRFYKLLEFKREHCPEIEFDSKSCVCNVEYSHFAESWAVITVCSGEDPASIYLDEKSAHLLAEQLNSGEFEL